MGKLKKRKIFLIGMPASGKTTVGKILARKLNVNFYDIDEIIEKKENKKVEDIFFDYDEEYFRMIEKIVIKSIALDHKLTGVFGSGGGTFQYEQNRLYMKQSGLVIYLNADLDLLWERLKKDETHPLLRAYSEEEKIKKLTKLYNMRKENFKYADIEILVEKNEEPEVIAEKIYRMVKDNEKIQLDG